MAQDRWTSVPSALGLILIAAGSAAGQELVTSVRDPDWSLLARAELQFYGGAWLVCGLFPRSTRIMVMTVFIGIMTGDLTRAVAGYPPRYCFGRVVVNPLWMPGSDLAIIVALQRWRQAAARAPWIDSHPGRVVATALIGATLGATIDWSQVAQFPIIATARSVRPSSSPGLDYLVYTPDGYYRSLARWPLLLALHGSGTVGRDIDRVRRDGLPRHIEQKGTIPFVAIAPQSPSGGWDVNALDALLDEVLRRYRIDADQVYLTGLSMGGYGTWAMAAAQPERFAAIAPICGGGDPAWADRLRSVPIWAFHGADDSVVPPMESRKMIAAIQRAGGDVRLTVYPGIGHDAWTITYDDQGFYGWLLSNRRRPLKR